jgi:hypothetical protein
MFAFQEVAMPKWSFGEIPDPAGLSDADWAELNKLKAAFESGGKKAMRKALKELAADPIRWVRVIGALYPEMMREQIKDVLADRGITEADVREMLRKALREAESPSSEEH